MKDKKVERKVLYGEDIEKNTIPYPPSNSLVRLPTVEGRDVGLNDVLLSTHMLLVGSSGCGKTTLLNKIVKQILEQSTDQDAMIIFDPTGGYARRFYQPGNKRHMIAGTGSEYGSQLCSWNIFDEMCIRKNLFDQRYRQLAREFAKTIMSGRKNQTQPFFTDAPTDLIADVLIDHVQIAAKQNDASILTTRNFVDWIRRAGMEEWLALTEKPEFRGHRKYIGSDISRLSNQALGVFGEMQSAIEDLSAALEGNEKYPFSMRDIIQNPGGKVLFLEYDLTLGELQMPLFRLWLDLAMKFALGRYSGTKGNIWLIVDEQSMLSDLKYFSDALNFGRQHGLKIISALQSINQFRDGFGEQADSLLAGFGSCFAFRCNDAATREYLSGRFGRNFVSLNYRDAKDAPLSETREGYVIEDWDLPQKAGEAVLDLCYEDSHPFRCRFTP